MAEILHLSRHKTELLYQNVSDELSSLLIHRALYALQLSGERITLDSVTDFIYSIPRTEEQFHDDTLMNNSVFGRCLIKIQARAKENKVTDEDYQRVKKFWLFDYLAFQMTEERLRKFSEAQRSLTRILTLLGDAIKN